MNDMFSSNENDERYTYSIDEYDRIITEPVASNVELDYDIGNCYIAALAGLAVYFIPVVSSSRRSLKKSLYEMLSE